MTIRLAGSKDKVKWRWEPCPPGDYLFQEMLVADDKKKNRYVFAWLRASPSVEFGLDHFCIIDESGMELKVALNDSDEKNGGPALEDLRHAAMRMARCGGAWGIMIPEGITLEEWMSPEEEEIDLDA